MDDSNAMTDQDAAKGSRTLRIIVLGAFYALAIAFAVVFSPSMNVVQHHPTGEVGRMASAEPQARR